MKKRVLWGLALLMLLVGAPAHATLATFDSNNEGFKTSYYAGGSTYWDVDSTWNTLGGNPGGYISGYVDGVNDRIYGFAKYGAASFGNLTGKSLTVDYKITGSVTVPTDAYVRFYVGEVNGGNNYWVTNDAYSWNPNSGSSWTRHIVSMDESKWVKWPNQQSGSTTWSQVLSQYNDIGLVFADGTNFFNNNNYLGFQGSGTIGIDNFNAVPVPGAVWLLGTGLLGLVGIRRRLRSE